METYEISHDEILELKQTMGFRISTQKWNEFADSHLNGCTSIEMIDMVKQWMNPPYEVDDLDAYLERILKSFVNFVRG